MQAYGQTDTGCVRTRNQDYIYFSPEQTGDLENLFFLADGMGGYNGGEIASKLAVQTAKNYIENNFKDIEKDKDSIIQLLGSSMEYANMVVYEKSKDMSVSFCMTLRACLFYRYNLHNFIIVNLF